MFTPTSAREHDNLVAHSMQKYLGWLNEQLLACNCTEVRDIGDSLADGVYMIKALSVRRTSYSQ